MSLKISGKGWWWGRIAPKLRERWTAHGALLLRIAVVLVAIGTLLRLLRVFQDLLWDLGPGSAGDLKSRHLEVHTWFAGLPIYETIETADYPPASYAILWPFLGWLPLTPARWFWGATILAALGTLAYVWAHLDKPGATLRWLFVAFIPFAGYPTAAVIGLGQLTIHTLAALAAGLFLLHRGRGRWWEDVLAAGLLILSLAKPTVTAPFFWLVLFLPGRLRPMALVLLGYLALTLCAVYFQDASLPELIRGWLGHESKISLDKGYINLSGWLATAGFEKAIVPVALLTLLGLGAWAWLHRAVDYWLLVGIIGLATRFWIHHRAQDDLLILFPMIALLRLAKQPSTSDGRDVTAGLLFALNWITLMAPTDLLGRFPVLTRLKMIWMGSLWAMSLLFLLSQAWKERAGISNILRRERLRPSEVST
ncbi:MAG TPA: glycosyltransferase 87 family protein [Blastocatellia bacterium]|nr:glycosyltransferase 87 family protein [Blastocatellia bacterium]